MTPNPRGIFHPFEHCFQALEEDMRKEAERRIVEPQGSVFHQSCVGGYRHWAGDPSCDICSLQAERDMWKQAAVDNANLSQKHFQERDSWKARAEKAERERDAERKDAENYRNLWAKAEETINRLTRR